ncbi:hypothetical protein BHE74_00042037 [Ensete ventricosum]|uniref:Uncharacterized protein n=1 Tax=Ensete ventricosum TaxID=4639 RepID=A0A445M9U0_ENSVE|nr:hypothetical protein BHE74_00042037 [Ensete ventricosum]RZR70988.1 hypothetical protein BHM03_00002848 [Ensete ventricosum]
MERRRDRQGEKPIFIVGKRNRERHNNKQLERKVSASPLRNETVTFSLHNETETPFSLFLAFRHLSVSLIIPVRNRYDDKTAAMTLCGTRRDDAPSSTCPVTAGRGAEPVAGPTRDRRRGPRSHRQFPSSARSRVSEPQQPSDPPKATVHRTARRGARHRRRAEANLIKQRNKRQQRWGRLMAFDHMGKEGRVNFPCHVSIRYTRKERRLIEGFHRGNGKK